MTDFWAAVGPSQWHNYMRDHILLVVERYSGDKISKEQFDSYPERALRIYEEWLALSGLRMARTKSHNELGRELAILSEQRTRWEGLYHRNLAYFQRVINSHSFNDNHTCSEAQPSEASPDLDGFFKMMSYLERWSKFEWNDRLVFGEMVNFGELVNWVDPMIRLWHRRCQWRRSIEDWRPKSDDPKRQFASLLRHLIAEYDVPVFMDEAWLNKGRFASEYCDAWIHFARGNNARAVKFQHWPLTKKAAHYFMSAPEEMTIDHALKWAHMKTFNLRPRATAAMLGSQWGSKFHDQPFWDSFLRFLVANPTIAAEKIGPLINYIYCQKFHGPVVRYERLGHEEIAIYGDPPHPGFSMRGRSGPALLDQVENWHRELGRTRASNSRDAVYRKSGWSSWEDVEKLSGDETAIWQFVEILTESDLHEEGRTMRHCIYSYHARVAAGDCSIWSLRKKYTSGEKDEWMERKLTVEVSSKGRVNEARCFANKLPEGRAKILLQQWADKNSLSFEPYVFL